MEKFDQISDKITKYLMGNLSSPELEAFSAQLNADSELKEEVEFRRFVMEGVKSFNNEKLRASISSSMKEVEKPTGQISDKTTSTKSSSSGKIISFGRRQMAIAASVLVLLTFGTFWNANQNYSNPSLVASYHDLPSPSVGLKGDAENNSDLFKEVAAAYSSKDFAEAIRQLSSVQPSPSYNKAQFHLGNTYLEVNQPQDAIKVFQALLKIRDVRYQEEVEWLLAVAHLQNDDLSSTNKQLNEILQNKDHSMYEKALELKKQLNSFWRKLVW